MQALAMHLIVSGYKIATGFEVIRDGAHLVSAWVLRFIAI